MSAFLGGMEIWAFRMCTQYSSARRNVAGLEMWKDLHVFSTEVEAGDIGL